MVIQLGKHAMGSVILKEAGKYFRTSYFRGEGTNIEISDFEAAKILSYSDYNVIPELSDAKNSQFPIQSILSEIYYM